MKSRLLRLAIGALIVAAASTPAAALSPQQVLADIEAAQRMADSDAASAAARLTVLADQGNAAARALAAWALSAAYRELHDGPATAALLWRLDRSSGGLDRSVGALVRAQRLREEGKPDQAAREAQDALQRLEQALAGVTPGAPEDTLRVEALRLLGAVLCEAGQVDEGLRHLQNSRRLAQALGDGSREVLALHEEAATLSQIGQTGREQAAQAEALDRARGLQPPHLALQATLHLGIARRALRAGAAPASWPLARSAATDARLVARAAGARALEAQALIVLAQVERLDRASKVAQQHGHAALRLLAHTPAAAPLRREAQAQIGLAQVAAGEIAAGRAAVEAAILPGHDPLAPSLLRQLDEALRGAGDARAALEVYHRERGLVHARLDHERGVVLRDLQQRHDRERQQRELETLARSNTLKATALEQRTLMQRALTAAAVMVTLGIVLTALLYGRLRKLRGQLSASKARLQSLSERDALTGLANRRHGQAVLAQLGLQASFEGALLVLDVDHFKQINDRHGHAAGDAVLVELAQRLEQQVRGDDLVVRWGGEEFVVVCPNLPAAQLPALARRLLHAAAGVPFTTPAGPLAVTVSIGCAHFPLPGQARRGWEGAFSLVDEALYAAKAGGRNRVCAVGATP